MDFAYWLSCIGKGLRLQPAHCTVRSRLVFAYWGSYLGRICHQRCYPALNHDAKGGKYIIYVLVPFWNPWFSIILMIISLFNPSWTRLPELRRADLPYHYKISKLGGKPFFFKVCHCMHYIKIIFVKVGLAKEKFLKKKLRQKNPRGADLPPPTPPRPTRVKLG